MNLHSFILRLVYGMATANFIAVTQLISSPQFQMKWGSGIMANFATVGMIMMLANIPISFAYGLYSETSVLTGRVPKHSVIFASFMSAFGLGGLALALLSYRIIFGLVFLWSALIALIFMLVAHTIRMRRDSN
jgi:hypothetical protein